MAELKRKAPAFRRFLLIYAAVLIFIILAALTLFYFFLDAYEASKPEACVRDQLARAADGALPEDCEDILAGLDPDIKSPQENRAFLCALISEAEPSRLSIDTEKGEAEYALTSDGTVFARLRLRQDGQPTFGFVPWRLEEAEFELSPFISRLRLTLPEGYSASLNGVFLSGEDIVDDNVEYETLSPCYESYGSLPRLLAYESGPYTGEAELKVFAPDGRELSAQERCEAFYLDNCSAEEKEELSLFIDAFLPKYVVFAADLGGNSLANYNQLAPYVLSGSELDQRLHKAFEGFGYSNTRAIEIVSSEIKLCSNLGDGLYLVDLNYIINVQGLGEPVDISNGTRLLIRMSDGGALAEAMYIY